MAIHKATVIGAGLIGASIAWRLAQAGIVVALVDAGSFGGETSSAGAGMLSPGGEFENQPVWSELGIESMSLYPDFVAELRARTKLSIDFQICGCTKFAEGLHDVLRESCHYPGDGFVDPGDLLRALRFVCTERGVDILENKPISKIDSTDHGALVIACGAWSNQLQVTYRDRVIALPPVKPIKGHLIGFDLASDKGAGETLGTRRLGSMLRRGHTYVLQRSNGFTIAGSTEEDVGFDRAVDPEICRDIQRRAAELWPPLENFSPSKCWVAFRPYSETPHIGRVEGTNVWLAYGHFRNGILLTPLTAQLIANDIAMVFAKPKYRQD